MLDDILFTRLTDIKYVAAHNKSEYSNDEFIAYIHQNKQKLKTYFFSYVDNLAEITYSDIDKFCIFLLTSLKKPHYDTPYHVGMTNGYYEPEKYFLNNKPYWYPVDVTSDNYYRRLHIYKSPLYTNQEFLPSQYTGHNRMYAKPFLARSIELEQNNNNNLQPSRLVPQEKHVSPVFPWSWVPTQDYIIAQKYKHKIHPDLYKKIVYGRPLTVFDYEYLTKTIPPNEAKVFLNYISDYQSPSYKYRFDTIMCPNAPLASFDDANCANDDPAGNYCPNTQLNPFCNLNAHNPTSVWWL